MSLKPIRSEADHEAALAMAARLMESEDDAGRDDLEVLQLLIEGWERARSAIRSATPAEAIRFRMDQRRLQPRDLIPYLGSKSRVSEILNGQRQPTVDQIRALNRHLGIPVDSLIGTARHEPARRASTASQAAVEKLRTLGVMKPREAIDAFIARASRTAPAMAMLRKTRTDRTNAKTDLGALEAWCAGVLVKAERQRLGATKVADREAAARDLARLSALPDGPARVRGALAELGVVLVILDHLPGTFLDGAAICRGDGAPVIAMTLRHDRLDNFWFTLLHEYAHVCRHLGDGTTIILDDLDVNSSEGIEAEADAFARDSLVPPDLWAEWDKARLTTDELVDLAAAAGVGAAVVAGRWRWQHHDYRRFSRLLGRGEVRPQLPDA